MIKPKWIPHKKQIVQYNAKQRYIHAIGEQRSGKSEGFFHRLRKEMLTQPGIKILVTRDTGTSLNFTFKHFMTVLERRLIIDEKQKPYPWVKINNGSEISFIPYDEMDTSKAGGSEYGIILIEESQRFSLAQYVYMDTRLSQQWGEAIGPDKKPYRSFIKYNGLWSTANPAGRGWAWQIFVRDHPMAQFGQDPNYLRLEFFRKDNERNLRKEYTDAMNSYPEHIRKKMLSAEENPMEGLVFPNFTRVLNVQKIKGFIPPSNWQIVGGMDYGYQTPTCFIWMAITEDGFCVVFREYGEIMKPIADNAKSIIEMNNDLMEKGVSFFTGALVDSSTTMMDGKSGGATTVFQQLQSAGMTFLSTARRNRDPDRAVRIRGLLECDPDKKFHPITGAKKDSGWPTLIFTDDCEKTICEFEEWEWAPIDSTRRDPKNKPEERDDHFIDCVSYALQLYFGQGSPEHAVTVSIKENTEEFKIKKIVDQQLQRFFDQRDNPVKVAPDGSVY